jgi:hypothetical protein
MWIPLRTRSFIRQVAHSKFICFEDDLHGPDARASYMEITYIRFSIRTTDIMVWTGQALIWKLHAAKVRPSGLDSIQERISAKFGKPIA